MVSAIGAGLVWLDGQVLRPAAASVAALDHGLTVGDGVFETLQVIDRTPFAFSRHVARLRRSASVLDLDLPLDEAALRVAVDELLAAVAATGDEPGRLRVTVTAGPGPLGSDRAESRPTVILAASPTAPWPPTERVVTVEWTRNERSAIAGAKTTSYAENVVALAAAHRQGAGEAILANTRDVLCEGTGSNVFVAQAGRLVTPALATGCLAGITREIICEIVAVDESESLTFADLRSADEVFLSSSTRNVHPVSHIDGHEVAASPGPLTLAAAEAFATLLARDLDP